MNGAMEWYLMRTKNPSSTMNIYYVRDFNKQIFLFKKNALLPKPPTIYLHTKQTEIIIVSLPVDLNIAVVAVVACQSCHSYFGGAVDASSGSSIS